MSTLEIKDLKSLLQDFYNLTGIKTCLYDLDGNELFFYPNKLNRFCEILRTDEQMDSKCKSCDKIAFHQCKKTQAQYNYICHAGLQECISPILYEGEIIGFMMLGQIKSDGASNFSAIEKNLPREMADRLRPIYESMPTVSEHILNSAFHILDACTGYGLLKQFVRAQNKAIDEQLKQYIRDHLASPISVSLLCAHFHISHCEIYDIFKKYLACTPAEYIKKCRLEYACKLLATSELPINKIAVLCGIPDYNYFSKVFKAAYGINPTAYRKSLS